MKQITVVSPIEFITRWPQGNLKKNSWVNDSHLTLLADRPKMIVDKGNHSILDARFRFLMYSKWVIPGEARLIGGFEQIDK